MRNWLKQLRLDAQMSRIDIAENLGIGRSYYSEIELGAKQQDMSLSMMIKIAEVFDMSVEKIMQLEIQWLKQDKTRRRSKYMRILKKPVGGKLQIVEIENTLEEMQQQVGGYIEAVQLGNKIVLVINEEGKFNGSEPNFRMGQDIVMGDCFFAGLSKGENGEEDLASITDEQMKYIIDVMAALAQE